MFARFSNLSAAALTVALLLVGFDSPNRAAADTAAAELTVKSGAVSCPPTSTADFCVVKGSNFLLSVDLIKAPAGGYIGVQTEIDYASLVYKPTLLVDDEIVWPDSGFALRTPLAPTGIEGQVNHGAATSLLPPRPVSTFEGNLVELTMNCTPGESTGNVISLVPLDAGNADGSGLKPPAGADVPMSDTINVDCVSLNSLVNNTGQPASYLRLSATFNINGTISSQPAACPAPDVFAGFEFVEFIWSTACIGPGEKVVVDLNFDPLQLVFGAQFLASPPVLMAVNGTPGVASELHIEIDGVPFAGALVINNAPGCAEPALDVKFDPVFPTKPVLLNVVWPEGCVDPGETVAVHIAATFGPTTSLPYSWTLVGPLPTPGSVGGVSFSPPSAGRGADGAVDTTTVIVLGLAAGSVALTTAAWHVRRRLR